MPPDLQPNDSKFRPQITYYRISHRLNPITSLEKSKAEDKLGLCVKGSQIT